jgi:hypothetical protein
MSRRPEARAAVGNMTWWRAIAVFDEVLGGSESSPAPVEGDEPQFGDVAVAIGVA